MSWLLVKEGDVRRVSRSLTEIGVGIRSGSVPRDDTSALTAYRLLIRLGLNNCYSPTLADEARAIR